MNQIIHILKFKLIAFLRLESKLTFSNSIKNISGSIIYLGFAAASFFFIQKFISFLIIDIKVGLFLLHQFISIIFYILFISINIGNIIVSYSTLYRSTEVTYLLTKPLIPVKIFAVKYLDNFFYSSSTLFMIIISVIAGYVSYFNLGHVAFLLLLVNSLAFMLSAASLGVIILMILIQLSNRFGFKRVIFILVTLYILTILLFFRMNSPKLLVTTVMKYYPSFSKDLYLSDLIPSISKYLPNEWLSQSAFYLVKSDYTNSLLYLTYQIGLTLLLFAVLMFMGHKWYLSTWLLDLNIGTELKRNRQKENSYFSFSKNKFLSPLQDAFFRREFLMFFREPAQVIHSLVLFFLILIFIISISGIKFAGIGNYYLQTMIYCSIFIFNLLFVSTLSLRFIFPLISLEGQGYWRIKSAPVNPSQLLINRAAVYTVIIVAAGIGLSYFSNANFGIELTLIAVTLTVFATLAIISINLGMGGIYANFREKNPIRISSSQGASLSFLINIVLMLFLVVILFRPLSSMFLSIMLKKQISLNSFYEIMIPVILTSLLLTGIFIKIGFNSLKRDF
ncbi:MAG: hypothetical protein WC061_04470 [Melioribacteraceae bacterium]